MLDASFWAGCLPLAVSDAVAISLGTGFIALIGTIVFPGIMAYLFAKLNREQATRAREVATKVEEVKTDLSVRGIETDKKLNGLAIVAESSHAFANARYGLLLDRLRQSDLRLANNTDLTEDKQRAAASEMDYQSHVAAQHIVDVQPGTDAEKAGKR